MAEDPAAYLALRVRTEHSLDGPASTSDLIQVCSQRGCPVVRAPSLGDQGYYLASPQGSWIVLRQDAGPRVLAHELFHHLVTDNADYGVFYTLPDFSLGCEEEGANRFAWLMCGES
jgi:hypothetical protein